MMRFCWKTENFAWSAQFWFQSIPLVLTKRTRTHILCFCPQITKLLGVLSDHAMAHTCTIRHCKLASPRVNEPHAHLRRACDSRNYRRVIVEISTCWPMEVLHRNSMWGIIITNIPIRTNQLKSFLYFSLIEEPKKPVIKCMWLFEHSQCVQ